MVGWETRTLGEVCAIARGGSPRPIQAFLTDADDGINWIKISDATASGKYIYSTAEKIKPAGAARSRVVVDGDFLLSNSMSFGRPYIMRTTGCIHDGWLVLSKYEDSFEQDFLYHLLGSPQVFGQFDRLAAGSTVRNLNIDLASRVVVPIPPASEQRRIVAVLDEAFKGIANAKANAENTLQNARELFASAVAKVFSADWPQIRIEDVCQSIMDCVNKTAPTVSEATPYKMIRTTNVRNGVVNLGTVNYVSEDVYKVWTRRQVPRRGDVILTREAPMGEVGMLDSDEQVFLGQRLVSYRAEPTKLVDRFLLYALQSEPLQRQIHALASGSTVQHMRVPDSKNLQLPLPGLQQQREAVAMLDAMREETTSLGAICARKIAALDELKGSLLHQAFTGALPAKATGMQLEVVA